VTAKLSIAIPTYNGSRYIREALDSIISQLGDIDEEVEIVISDNASTDETPEIIREYQNQYPFIKYFRNEENIGADRNFDLAVKRSTGEYVWLFSDDDKLKQGAIRKVLQVLQERPNIGLIWVNYGIYNEDFSICTMERRDLESLEDVYCDSADKFYTTTHILSASCSTNIVKRKAWNEVDKSGFFESQFVHVGVVSSYLIKENNAYCINYPYVMIRMLTVSRWANHGNLLIYSLNLSSIIRGLTKIGYRKDTIDEIFDRHIIDDMLEVCVGAKVQNIQNLDFSLLKALIRNYGNYPSFWLIHLPALLLPNQFYRTKIARLMIGIGKKWYKKRKR
jgi:abequosyltransferase